MLALASLATLAYGRSGNAMPQLCCHTRRNTRHCTHQSTISVRRPADANCQLGTATTCTVSACPANETIPNCRHWQALTARVRDSESDHESFHTHHSTHPRCFLGNVECCTPSCCGAKHLSIGSTSTRCTRAVTPDATTALVQKEMCMASYPARTAIT